jgi:regulator of replication initiation timing
MIIKDCFRQLKRLALSMQGIRYSVCIFQDKYFSIVEEDLADCYYIKNFSTDSRRLFFVVCDLEYFYEKMGNINGDIETIKTSIYRLLDKNAEANIETISKIMKRLVAVDMSDKEIVKKKTDYMSQIQKYKVQLDEFSKSERQIMSEMKSDRTTEGGFFNDTAFINKKAGLQSKLDSINNERQKVIRIIVELRQKCDNIYLNTDKIEFDNCILANGIAKNFMDLDATLKIK